MGSLPSMMPRLRREVSRDRIDRLAWRAGTCFDAYGLRVGVRFNDPALLERLGPHLPPGWRPCASPEVDQIFSVWVSARGARGRTVGRVYAGGQRRALAKDLGQALDVLESEIRQSVAAAARGRTFVHAGVVGWRGHAILVPGRSRSGKTTLVAELVKSGAVYYSDEFAVLDRHGRVHPFAKSLSIREGGCARHEVVRRRHAEELGGSCGEQPLPVGLVVLASYRPGAEWRPATLTRGQAVLEMLAHTVPARLRPKASLAALERAVARATVLRGERDEASEARGPAAATDRGNGAGLPRRDGIEGDVMKPAARRTGLVVRELPGELIVYDLDRHQAHCLNRTAASVFRGADGTRSLDDLGALLGDGFDRAEREAAVRMALDQLASAQLLDPGRLPLEPAGGLSRRSALRRAGLGAALLLPAVASVVAPTPAEAAATCITDCTSQLPGTPCNCTPGAAPPCDSACDGANNCLGC